MLNVKGLKCAFNNAGATVVGVDDVSFNIEKGACYALLGPSGCGKTTTLRCVAGLQEPSGGVIEIDGRVVYDATAGICVPTHERPIGVVFQSYAIWPHMTVFENVAYPLRVQRPRLRESEIRDRVMNVLSLVGMQDIGERPAPRLSGGQQQRVALARAIVRNPALVLLDEPLSNLDAVLRDHMRKELAELIARVGVTALFVTHDQIEAMSLAHRIAVMKDGRIVQEGAPREIYAHPRDIFVAQFLGAANTIEGVVDTALADGRARVRLNDGQSVTCRSAAQAGSPVTLVLRPERLRLSASRPDGSAGLAAQVRSVTFLGGFVECVTELGDARLRVIGPPDVSPEAGAGVWLCLLDEPIALPRRE